VPRRGRDIGRLGRGRPGRLRVSCLKDQSRRPVTPWNDAVVSLARTPPLYRDVAIVARALLKSCLPGVDVATKPPANQNAGDSAPPGLFDQPIVVARKRRLIYIWATIPPPIAASGPLFVVVRKAAGVRWATMFARLRQSLRQTARSGQNATDLYFGPLCLFASGNPQFTRLL
jgi:hypothetical protein